MVLSSLLIACLILALGMYLIFPAIGTDGLGAIYSEWTRFTPWSQSSINVYRGNSTAQAILYPAPVLACLLALSLLAYLLLILVSRMFSKNGRLEFNWRVVATLSVVCWMGLDLLWQTRLLQQLHTTHKEFSGKDPAEKLAAAVDGELYKFIQRVNQTADDPGARFFLATSDDYLGVRGSYNLYPRNTYWNRRGEELPEIRYLHNGDYVVLVRPTKIRFDRRANTLLISRQGSASSVKVQVKPLILEHIGGLFEVQ